VNSLDCCGRGISTPFLGPRFNRRKSGIDALFMHVYLTAQG